MKIGAEDMVALCIDEEGVPVELQRNAVVAVVVAREVSSDGEIQLLGAF